MTILPVFGTTADVALLVLGGALARLELVWPDKKTALTLGLPIVGKLILLPALVVAIILFAMASKPAAVGTLKTLGIIYVVFFILTLNLMAMIPIEKVITLVTGRPSHLGGPATANIFVTGAMAVMAFVMSHVYGIRQHGFLHYLAHLAPPAPKWLLPLVYPLELLSIFIRPFTLAIRLFANIIAGHMVLATVLGLIFVFQNWSVAVISVAASVALSFLELLVAFIQAYVFAFLTTLYIGLEL